MSKSPGRGTYLYRAIDLHGQVIDVLVSEVRNARAARTFFTRADLRPVADRKSPPTGRRSTRA
jgi:transposase-like protein